MSLAPFVSTTFDIVGHMFELAHAGREDTVVDLGCGDGRILITAVTSFEVQKAIGYELRRDLYERAVGEIHRRGLEGRAIAVNEDLMKADLREATVITLYLTTAGNETLRPKLEREGKRGTRVVSHDFKFAGWTPTSKESFNGHMLYLFTLPKAHSYDGDTAETKTSHAGVTQPTD